MPSQFGTTAWIMAAVLVTSSVMAGCLGDAANNPGRMLEATTEDGLVFVPHVIVGVTDTGIDPYQVDFYRPGLTQHPCTYVRNFPCDVKELRLTLGIDDWNEAFEQDRAVWESLERETWYWIPQTVFVAVYCPTDGVYDSSGNPAQRNDICILDDNSGGPTAFPGHGTGSTGIVARENPDALIAFAELPQGSYVQHFGDGMIPVDLTSISVGPGLTTPPFPRTIRNDGTVGCGTVWQDVWPIHVTIAGNTAWPTVADCSRGDPRVITVGGGHTDPRSHYSIGGNMADVESYFCRPFTAAATSPYTGESGELCGTSWATPTVAGALSKVILEIRNASGYDGSLTPDGYVDPLLGITIPDLRDAMNRTATYAPPPMHAATSPSVQWPSIPLNPAAPWLQWGWGFYDGDIANATIAHLLGTQTAPEKPAEAVAYMDALYTARQTMYG